LAGSSRKSCKPKPFYYSIRADGDPVAGPEYDVTDCTHTAKEGIALPYIDVGHVGPFTPTTPQDGILKSDAIDDAWSFKGSE
jgi:hypothetical protein